MNKNNNLEKTGLDHPKALEWLEMRPFGDITPDEEWVDYCAKWEEYESQRSKSTSRYF